MPFNYTHSKSLKTLLCLSHFDDSMGKCSHFNYKFVNWENVSILITSLGITWENIPIFIKSLVISCENVAILITSLGITWGNVPILIISWE